ncbi:phosphotransferase family protein [Actinopolymorpha alba]|uniref:phosphotransferase family protein n=1 Tax=Actinopolymorpha alba TaxID=533267 RepID=UPI00036535F3|nr:phosphotransferase [Actinopolymorpha alba]
MTLTEEPSLAELIEAVEAEDRSVDLSGAVRRAGDQNFVLETAEWIYRFPRSWIDFDREVAVLAALDGRLPVEIPRVEWVGQRSRFCAYRKIIGWPFDRGSYLSATRSRQQALAASMAEYLAALHQALTEPEIASIGIPDFFSLEARADLIDANDVPVSVRPDVNNMLTQARELSDRIDGRVLLDNDFTSDNIVLEGEMGSLSGVWDFSGVREAFVIAFRITDLRRHLRRGRDVVRLVQSWKESRRPS